MIISKRLYPDDPGVNLAEKTLHFSRYQYASRMINKNNRFLRAKILDAGCGLAYGSDILSQKTKLKTIGVDIDTTTIKRLTEKFKSDKRLKFIKADIQSLPFNGNSFDYAVCFETIEHLTMVRAKKTVHEFYRVLKPGGYLFISSPNPFFTKIMKKIVPQYHNPYHLHEFYPQELKTLLNKSGFNLVESRGQYPFFPLLYLLIDKLSFLKFFFEPKSYFFPEISRYFLYLVKK